MIRLLIKKELKKDLVKGHCDVMRGHIRHLPGRTEVNTKNVCDRQCQGWHLGSSEYETGGHILSAVSVASDLRDLIPLRCSICYHFWGKNYFMYLKLLMTCLCGFISVPDTTCILVITS
jgi:hypothetical protein